MKQSLSYENLAEQVAKQIVTDGCRLIGITGTSCIGKSSLTGLLKKKLEQDEAVGRSVQIIGADSYLKECYRDGTRFWNGSAAFLTPEHFDWYGLRMDIERLRQGECVERNCYVRGIGWNSIQVLKPAQILIVEGLFLDAVGTVHELQYDRLLVLAGSDALIRKLRMARDDYYRQNFKEFTRTEQGTREETEQTLLAGKSYEKCTACENMLHVWVQEGFQVTVSSGT